jgi:hypothetical protein
MAHASLLDLWNAGTQTVAQGLDLLSREKRYELETLALQQQAAMDNLQTKLVLEYANPDAENPYRTNPDKYRDYVNAQFAAWRDNAARQGNDSPYYHSLVERIYQNAQQNMGEKILTAEVQTKNQRTANNLNARINVAINNSANEQEILENGFKAIDEYRSQINFLDETETQEYVDRVRQAALKKATEFTPTANTTTAEINAFYNSLSTQRLREAAPGEDGRSTYASLPNARSHIEAARKGAIEAAQAARFNALSVKDAAYKRAIRDYNTAVQSNDPGAIQAARIDMTRAYNAGIDDWEAAMGKDRAEYNPKNELAMLQMFPALPGDDQGGRTATGGYSRASQTAMENLVKNNIVFFIDAGITGEYSGKGGAPSMYAAREAFLNETVAELEEKFQYQGNARDFEKDFYSIVGTFFDEAEKRLTPELQGVLKDAKEYAARIYEEDIAKNYPDIAAAFIGEAEEFILDLLWSRDLSQLSRNAVKQRFDEFVATQTSKEIEILRFDPKTGQTRFRAGGFDSYGDEALSKAIFALQYPDALWTDAQTRDRYAAGIREGVGEVRKAQIDRLADVLGIDRTDDIQITTSPGENEYDRDATPIYTHAGKRYRFYSEDGKSYVIQRELEDGSGWDFDNPVAGTRAQGRSAERAENRSRRSQLDADRQGELQDVWTRSLSLKIAPKGVSLSTWQSYTPNQKLQYLNRLRGRDPEAYKSFKQAVEQHRGGK